MTMVESNESPLARAASTPAERSGPDEPVEDAADLLVEEISIDGMCGVY
jgi:mycofactocin precursor